MWGGKLTVAVSIHIILTYEHLFYFFVWGMCYTGCVKDEAMNGKELVNRQTFGAAYISCHFLEY